MNKQRQGFTLIELMIVITILGILSSISLVAYLDYAARAQVTEALVQMDGLKHKVQLYFQEEGSCIDNNVVILGDITDQNGIAAKTAYSGYYISEVLTGGTIAADNDGGCNITGKFKQTGLNNALQGKSITYTLYGFKSHTPQWACHTPDIDPKSYLIIPIGCRFSSFEDAKSARP